MKILIDYFKATTEQPSRSKTAECNIQSGFNLGQFWYGVLKGYNKVLFEKAREDSPNMQLAYDQYLVRNNKI